MKTPSLIFHTLRLTFLQEAIFPETPQGSQQGRLLSKVDRFFFCCCCGRSLTFVQTVSTLTLDSNSIWRFLSFLRCLLLLCFKKHRLRDAVYKRASFRSCVRSDQRRRRRGGFVFVCVWVCLNTSVVSQSLHLQEALLYSTSSSCKGEKMELCASFDVASAKCCQRETVVLEMKRGSIRLTPLTCHMCHVSFGLSSF